MLMPFYEVLRFFGFLNTSAFGAGDMALGINDPHILGLKASAAKPNSFYYLEIRVFLTFLTFCQHICL